jgi:signal transduction histidine kinase
MLMSAPIFTFIVTKAKVKDVEVAIEAKVDPATQVVMDAKRLLQVVTNLLENGLRYTPQKGRLTFALERSDNGQGSHLVFRVSDTGIGIDPEDLTHVFESFYQGKDPSQRGRLGLGLSIAKEIVEGHGGQIEVSSPGCGKGATFSFRIPLSHPAPSPLEGEGRGEGNNAVPVPKEKT